MGYVFTPYVRISFRVQTKSFLVKCEHNLRQFEKNSDVIITRCHKNSPPDAILRKHEL